MHPRLDTYPSNCATRASSRFPKNIRVWRRERGHTFTRFQLARRVSHFFPPFHSPIYHDQCIINLMGQSSLSASRCLMKGHRFTLGSFKRCLLSLFGSSSHLGALAHPRVPHVYTVAVSRRKTNQINCRMSSSDAERSLSPAAKMASKFTHDAVSALKRLYPPELADNSFDNTGLLLEASHDHIQGEIMEPLKILLTVDLTERVTEEAIRSNVILVMSYRKSGSPVSEVFMEKNYSKTQSRQLERGHHNCPRWDTSHWGETSIDVGEKREPIMLRC